MSSIISDKIVVELYDEQLAAIRLRAEGSALRWDELDEDISISGLLQGVFEAD